MTGLQISPEPDDSSDTYDADEYRAYTEQMRQRTSQGRERPAEQAATGAGSIQDRRRDEALYEAAYAAGFRDGRIAAPWSISPERREQLETLIELSRRDGPSLWARIDAADAHLLDGYRWIPRLAGRSWYAYGWKPGSGTRRIMRMHNLITGWPMVDHIDHDGLNNTRANLRPANKSLNGANRRKGLKPTSSPYKGVTWGAARGKWIVRIQKDRKTHYVGYFDDDTEAAKAYDEAAVALFGEYACLNFPAAA